MTDYAPGFQTLDEEVTDVDLDVQGALPGWLSGTLLRNGPGRFEVGGEPVDHWFDGLAMLRKFSFGGGGVAYSNRFLRSDAYRRAERGEPTPGFATGSGSLWARLKLLLGGSGYDNANVVAERVGDQHVALTETPSWVGFDPATLETTGSSAYDGPAPSGHLACAHLGFDPDGRTVLNFETEFGYPSQYHVYEMTAPGSREHVVSVPVQDPAYMHSFALTERYVVLTEFPFVVDPLDLLNPFGGGFVDAFRWEPERGTRFLVVDRTSGSVVAEPTVEPFFGFHHVNAFERGGDVVFDLETVPDAPTSVGALSLARLRAGDLDLPAGTIERFRVSDPDGAASVERSTRYEGGTALPTVSPAVRAREHRYVYAQGLDQPATTWPGRVEKVDVTEGSARRYEADGYPSEPIFVPRPGGDREDDGVVLTVVLDAAAARSRLVVLDGATLAERARAPLPHALPFDFHGRYVSEP